VDSSETVRTVLVGAKQRGADFEDAWFWAMRAISPPRTCGPELRAERDLDRKLMHEVKPIWQAAYEGREVTELERQAIAQSGERRVARVLGAVA
jgi:hypothetical protein